MKTTARNQFAGTITELSLGPVSAELTIALAGGQEITATVTTHAARHMGLENGGHRESLRELS